MNICECVLVHYLVESDMHLFHQVSIELADKSFQLLSISDRLRLTHLVSYYSHHCMLNTRMSHINTLLKSIVTEEPPSPGEIPDGLLILSKN